MSWTKCAVTGLGLVMGLGVAAAAQSALPKEVQDAPRLRVCCALGYDLDLRFGQLRAPVAIQNVVETADLGHHRYQAHSVFDEKNGQVYTCRGGFIDVGHLRSAADLVAYVYAQLKLRPSNQPITRLDLPDGEVRIIWKRPVASDQDLRSVAQRLSYAVTVWHEIVTGRGQGTISVFSEAFSALSPEDLYSDLLGTHIGLRALMDARPYDAAAQALTEALLTQLQAQPLAHTRQALDQVEGQWWDQSIAIPQRELLRVRNLSFLPPLTPWQVPKPQAVGCPDAAPFLATLPERLPSGARPEDLYSLEFMPNPGLGMGPIPVRTDQFAALMQASAELLAQPQPAQTPQTELAGIHIMGFRGFGGLGHNGKLGLQGGLQVIGAHAEGTGGDLSIARFTAAYDPRERGLIAHFTGIEAGNLFFCEERGGGRQHPPIAAWFQSCEPTGFFGIGGTLAQFQHDGATGRWAMRPLEGHLSFALLENAFSPEFSNRHLELQTGVAVENVTVPGLDSNFSVRLRSQLQGHVQSENLRWQGRGHLLLHRDVIDAKDQGAELGVDLLHRFLLRSQGRHPWAVAELGVQVAYSYWSQPGAALDDRLLPLASAVQPHSYRALVTVGFRPERWVF